MGSETHLNEFCEQKKMLKNSFHTRGRAFDKQWTFSRFFSTFDMPDKFGKILRRHYYKGRLKISKTPKLESDFLKADGETAPQSRESLQTFVWYGHTETPRTLTIQTSVNFQIFATLQSHIFAR